MSADNHIPSTKDLRAFELVARLGSMKSAAEALNITPSALSRRIQSLEEYLGQPLLLRDIKGLQLTDAGQAYAKTLQSIFSQLTEATRLARVQKQRTLLVVAPSLMAPIIIRLASCFQDAYPHLQLEIHTTSNVSGSDPLLDVADVAILYGQGPFDGWHSHHISPGAFTFAACAPGYLKDGMADDPYALARHTWIQVRHFEDAWSRWYDAQGLTVPQPARLMTVNTAQLAFEAACNGLGIMMAGGTPYYAHETIQNGAVVPAHGFHAFGGSYGYYLAVRNEKIHDPDIVAYFNWTLEKMQNKARK